MEVIFNAKKHHDANCPWKGEGKRINMTAFDIDRMGWEEGDVIAGLTLVADAKLATGRFEVHCDNEPKPDMEFKDSIADFKTSDDLVTA